MGRFASFWSDFTFGVRLHRQTPMTSAVVIATLAFAIAANAAAFSLVNGFFLRPPPVRDPEQLVRIYSNSPGGMEYFTVSYADYDDMRALTDVFSAVAIEEPVPLTLGIAGSHQRVWGERVSNDYFSLLGVTPGTGRFFTEHDSSAGAPAVVVLGHGLWQRAFGAGDVIGKTVVLNGQRHTIVGVTPARFHGMNLGLMPDVWIPVVREPEVVAARGGGRFFVVARLKPGIGVANASAALDVLAHRLERTYATNRGVRFPVLPESHGRIHPIVRGGLMGVSGVLLTVAVLILVLACTNAAAVLLARAVTRRGEIAIRLALGATRQRVVRQLLVESVTLAALAGVAGVAVAWVAVKALAAVPLPSARGAPIAFDLGLDARVVGFSVLVTTGSALLFGLAPALTGARAPLLSALKGEAAAIGGRPGTARDALIAVQIAMSLALLTTGGLFLRSLQNARHIDLGFEPAGVVVAEIDMTGIGSSPAGRADAMQLWRSVVRRVRALPHVEAASLADRVPFEVNITTMPLAAEENRPRPADAWPTINYAIVDEGYFETLRVPLLAGRDFSARDNRSASPVIIVNDLLAKRFWPNGRPIGRRLVGRDGTSYEVVGVVPRLKYLTLGEEPIPYVYLPLAQRESPSMTLLARSIASPRGLLGELGNAVRSVDESLAVYNRGTMAERMRLAWLPATSAATVLGVMSLMALLLTSVGLYGTVAYAVGRRTHEIGVRRAFGARSVQIVWVVMRRVVAFATAGLLTGGALAVMAARALHSLLYGVDPLDPLILGVAPVLMTLVCLVAAIGPARRAARIEPALALRRE